MPTEGVLVPAPIYHTDPDSGVIVILRPRDVDCGMWSGSDGHEYYCVGRIVICKNAVDENAKEVVVAPHASELCVAGGDLLPLVGIKENVSEF